MLLVHRNSVLGAGLCIILATRPDQRVVGEVDDDTAVGLAASLDPHIAVVDADSCRKSGLEVTAALHAACPQLGILVLGLHDNPQTRAEALRAGACSFVSKQYPEIVLEEIQNLGRPLC
jgi:DNA-binding NarL/FixJ family response regulator